MNGVELARQTAASLHAKAVEIGVDCWQPYAFAVAEAARIDLDVESTAVDAPILNGGRAVFIPSDRLILHERVGTPFEQAFLVAHEIGHALLGDDADEGLEVEIDPVRAAEPPAVGTERVVDYGHRQRREIQMDLFAREFLLPRYFVRRLHLEDGLSASAIAAKIGAPFAVVAQQLLDALLLPSIEPEEKKVGPELPPNDLQRAAIQHRGAAYLLEAGPGTGKTQTLTARVTSLLAEGVDPRRILLLTFSNKAAREMADRISAKSKDAAGAMWIGTFHAFGLDLIRRFHVELGLAKDPRLLDRTEAVELLEHEFPRLPLRHYRDLYDPSQIIADILAAISRAKDEVVDHGSYEVLAGTMLRDAVSPDDVKAAEQAKEVALVYALYEELKQKAHRVDFGDLVLMPVRLLEENPLVREHFQSLYDHILVDEYQDVNRSSVRLLRALRGAGQNLWVVGDAKQSIYRFRGASSFSMSRFGSEDFAGGERGYLRENYRSVSEVVGAFSVFASGMKAAGPDSALESARGSLGLRPELRTVDSSDEQTAALAEAIEEMRLAGYGYRDQAVLCTGNEKLSKLGRDLERLGIPVLFLGSLFERPEVKDLFALLSLLADRRAMGLVRLACVPEFRMSMSDVSSILDVLRNGEVEHISGLQHFTFPSEISDEGKASLTRLSAALEGFDKSSSPWEILSSILLDRTRIAARVASSPTASDRTRAIAIWQAMNFIRSHGTPPGSPVVSLLDRVRRLVRLGDDRDLRHLPEAAQGIDAVRLMTIHGAKGLEFPIVHLPGMNSDTIPSRPSAPACPPPDGMVEGGEGNSLEVSRSAHSEEQECLFYVALSRARDRLFLYAPTKKGNGHSRPLSPFLERLGSHLLRQHLKPALVLPPSSEDADMELDIEGGLRFEAHQITLFESCPRRFFYTHVLQIGGKRKTSPFMQMHDAVRTVVRQVIEGRGAMDRDGDLRAMLAAAFEANQLAAHGYVTDFEDLALGMLNYLSSIRQGHEAQPSRTMSLKFGEEEITVTPDEILDCTDGGTVLRRVRTGHRRSSEDEDLGAAAFMLAVNQHLPGARIEMVHLSDGVSTPLTLTVKKLQNRQDRLSEVLGEIRLGRFPANPSAKSCPGCPAFFICGVVPTGALRKKFR